MKYLRFVDIIIPTSDENSFMFKNCCELLKQTTNCTNIIGCNAKEGFSKTVNKELRKSDSEFICLLNDDTEPQENWLMYLVDRMNKDKRIGICGSKLLYPNSDIIQHAGIGFSNNDTILYGRGEKDSAKYNIAKEMYFVTFACVLLRKAMITEIGFLDEDFKFFYEDIDYCLRARLSGWKIFYEPKSVVFHYESTTIKKGDWVPIFRESKRRFLEKWKLGGKNVLADSSRM